MQLHLVDGTYELYRNYFGAPPRKAPDGREIGAAIGLLRSLMAMLEHPDVTHVAYAFDHIIESFRNDLYLGYKTGDGIEPDLWNQFQIAEDLVAAFGVTVWSMVEFEADDALAAGAARWAAEPDVERILLCSPDKDLMQMVGGKTVAWDRRRDLILDAEAVQAKFGVPPASIPDYLALVGDSADGYPGLPGWGAKSAASVLAVYGSITSIPTDPAAWQVPGLSAIRAAKLAATLQAQHADALLFRTLATLRTDVPLPQSLADLEWRGARPQLRQLLAELGAETIAERITRWQNP